MPPGGSGRRAGCLAICAGARADGTADERLDLGQRLRTTRGLNRSSACRSASWDRISSVAAVAVTTRTGVCECLGSPGTDTGTRAVDEWHPEVDDHRRRRVRLGQPQAFFSGVRHVDAVPTPLEHQGEPLCQVDVVVDDENWLIAASGGPCTRSGSAGRVLPPPHASASKPRQVWPRPTQIVSGAGSLTARKRA